MIDSSHEKLREKVDEIAANFKLILVIVQVYVLPLNAFYTERI
jgi:hypothetical protein